MVVGKYSEYTRPSIVAHIVITSTCVIDVLSDYLSILSMKRTMHAINNTLVMSQKDSFLMNQNLGMDTYTIKVRKYLNQMIIHSQMKLKRNYETSGKNSILQTQLYYLLIYKTKKRFQRYVFSLWMLSHVQLKETFPIKLEIGVENIRLNISVILLKIIMNTPEWAHRLGTISVA